MSNKISNKRITQAYVLAMETLSKAAGTDGLLGPDDILSFQISRQPLERVLGTTYGLVFDDVGSARGVELGAARSALYSALQLATRADTNDNFYLSSKEYMAIPERAAYKSTLGGLRVLAQYLIANR